MKQEKQKQQKPSILIMAASPNIGTGYGLLHRNLGQRLTKLGYDVKGLGLQSFGESQFKCSECGKDTYPYGFEILPIGDDLYGADILEMYIRMFDIRILITFIDVIHPSFAYVANVVRKTNVKWICHATVNATPIAFNARQMFTNADTLIAPSNFAKEELNKAGFEIVDKIYHGVDTDVFRPLPQKEIDEIKKGRHGAENKCVFLAVGVNQMSQKNYPGLFYAWKIFVENNPDAKENTILHCHTDPFSAQGTPLDVLQARHGIKNVFFTTNHKKNLTLPPEQMNEMYNYMDVFVTASYGESVCLPILESMAVGKPCIAPDFSAMPQWIKESKAGLTAKIKAFWTNPIYEDEALVDEIDLAKQMTKLYKDAKLRKEMGRKGIEYIKSKFNWGKHILPKWIKVINRFDMSTKEDKPLVSVMILSHNRKKYLKEALDSILKQTYPNIEIVVVDNGSEDGSVHIIKKMFESVKDKIATNLAVNGINEGCPTARNQALKLCTGKYIAIQDDDDISLPERIEEQVLVMESNPHVAVVSGNSITIDKDGKEQGKMNMVAGFVTHEMFLKDHVINSSIAMIRKEVFDDVGNFDEKIKIASDRDMWLRISKKYQMLQLDKVLSKYRIHKNLSIDKPEETNKYVAMAIQKTQEKDKEFVKKWQQKKK
ncbi:hypothetical protein LCGC14_1875870 [marine sediment metagenome]|uniref:Glycosyltransferase 2-like domain-containing protein n=1 Tax=marine sediment metagenome TaxID=412755 RepID=A0A0F9IHP9_9ZZZZ